MPPGGLHLVLLGPGNDIYNCIEKHLPNDKKHLLTEFENILPEHMHCFVELYRELDILYKTICRTKAKNDSDKRYDNLKESEIKSAYIKECKESIDSFMEVFNYCKFTFDLSKTNKVHTIESHVLDLIDMTGEPIGSLDQCIESVHQYFSKRMESSNYKIKTKTKDSHGKKLLQLVLHFNSYNIYS